MKHKREMNKEDRQKRSKVNPSKRKGFPDMSFDLSSIERHKVGTTTRENMPHGNSCPD
jgi:hypothetical protein